MQVNMKTSLKHLILSGIIATYTVLFLPFIVSGQGSLTTISFYSNSLNANKYAQVYLPQGYNPQDSIRYPAIYFLHGAWDDHTSNPQLVGILDNLIGDSTISPIIVIKPDGSVGPWAGSMYTNSELYGDFEDYIAFDLVDYIDSTYKTIPVREKRAIMGHSMGGYGSMKLGLKHPNIFSGVAAHSGPLDFNQFYLWVTPILNENGGAPVSQYNPNNGTGTYLFYTTAGAFSPNLNNPPYYVDFPLDSMGNFIDSTFNRWLLHDPARLASNLTPNSNLAIYFDCGMQDELLLYPFNTEFADSLDVYGLNYIFKSYTGGHNNQINNRFPIALSFLDSVMTTLTAIKDSKISSLSSFMLSQNYPNPFNPSTTIQFDLPKTTEVSLKVLNILGEEVATLVSDRLSAGSYSYNWDASDLASGVYLYRLQAGDYVETRKMVVMR
jgi:enterochelin esterase-like enzyme